MCEVLAGDSPLIMPDFYLCEEILIEILKRLPVIKVSHEVRVSPTVKSLMKFGLVPSFITTHLTYQKIFCKNKSLLFQYQHFGNPNQIFHKRRIYYSLLLLDDETCGDYRCKVPEFQPMHRVHGTCNGLADMFF